MGKWITKRELPDGETYTVRGQDWTEDARRELREEFGIVLHEDSVVPVKTEGAMLTIGIEDDGTLFFRNNAPSFHVVWAQKLIRELEEILQDAENL